MFDALRPDFSASSRGKQCRGVCVGLSDGRRSQAAVQCRAVPLLYSSFSRYAQG